MKDTEPYLTIGQMARLHHINKKTLLFYDLAGVFSPAFSGENGYRYYSYSQCRLLEKILFLRRLGVPVEDIQQQLKTAKAVDTLHFFSEQREKNLEHIRTLREYDRVLRQKEEELREALLVCPETIEVRKMPEQKYIVSGPSEGDSEISRFFSDILAQVGVEHLYYYSFGSILDRENLLAGKIEYSRYFVLHRRGMKGVCPVLRPAGDYLVAYRRRGPDSAGLAYERIRGYAQRHGLMFSGDAFERQLMDEFNTSASEEFLVEILIPVEKAGMGK